MDKILVIGASGHAKVVVDTIELGNEYKIEGFIDSFKPEGEKVLGYEILGKEEIIPDLIKKGIRKGIIAIGDNWTRYSMYSKINEMAPDFEFVSLIHPSAIVSKYATIGKGTVILTAGKVNADADVGDFCIINTNANLGHDCIMKNFSSLAPSVTVGGTVTIGEFSAISLGANIIQNLSIGNHTVIGSGAVVTHDISDHKVAYGIPAKVIRKRKEGESYLNHMILSTKFKVHKIKDEIGLEKYKEALQSLNNSNPFYKTELLDTTDMNKYQLNYFVLEKSEKPIIVMPFYIREITIEGEETVHYDITSPYGYSGPLFDTEEVNDHLIQYFWQQTDQWYRRKKVVSEFIRFSLNDNFNEYSGVLVPSLKNVKGVILDKEEQWNKFKPKVRNNYRKAIQEGLEIVVYQNPISEEIIKDFYDIYIQTMQRNNAHSQYFHYIDYFRNFILENPDSRIIAMVYKDSVPISTELILIGGDTLYSYLGGTLSDYFFTRPNDFLKIEVMNWARDNNYKYYVLGGGRENGDGLYKYKKSFFPNDEDAIYYTGRKIVDRTAYDELIEKKCNPDGMKCLEDTDKSFFPLYRQND
ncbi:NeuD/PglB/VioB family sugar acetyltransferase [Aquimarina sp. 2201CG5-10]|uniref:NeuD/PglB/VioB family sugar acetyltransferase n=1 Tax=Aquimarina callyspongiae TaxID=3098150 RepID=UPI002AB4FB3C|nr:NeuD/PglB/VioB family sugar acetyltransferase [Aquimarina sp. 2201CG5-10]MDY8136278.1 NeuD/PglB/VioB family sugar acetyltransferase [Aquimarina sp. 2201CG5-10]